MRKLLIVSGLALSVAAGLSTEAAARNRCEGQKHQDRVTGSILGGVVGALAGGAIGGDATGALVGAGVGAVGGNAIAASRDPKCDQYYSRQGYYWDQRNGAYRPYRYDRRYYDRYGYPPYAQSGGWSDDRR